MTSTERLYYDQLSSFDDQHSDWSHSQLLSISILDGVLAMIDLAQNFNFHQDSFSDKWQEEVKKIRQETHQQWILDEKIVLTRLAPANPIDSTCCISSNTLAKRRSIFEQRVILLLLRSRSSFSRAFSWIIRSLIMPVVSFKSVSTSIHSLEIHQTIKSTSI